MTPSEKQALRALTTDTIDNGICTACNCTVTYDESSTEEEVCIRTKPYCTKSEDEHVDWRASCLHATACAQKAEAEVASLRSENESLKAALREACGLADAHVNSRMETITGVARDSADAHSLCLIDSQRLAILRQKAG